MLTAGTPWSEPEAIKIQRELARLVRVDRPMVGTPRLVAGVDVAYESGSARAGRLAGAVVVLDLTDLSVVAGIPAFGVAKTSFVGVHGEVPRDRGGWSDLTDGGDVVGRALRTQDGVKPVFVSAGHLIDIAQATELTLRMAPRYRLPETTRRADRASRDALEPRIRPSIGTEHRG